MLGVHINFFLYVKEAGKMEWGIGKREGEKEREKQIKGLGDGA